MPIYEFSCQGCGHEFEQIQSFSDNTLPDCPVCQGTHVNRRVGRPAIHFKGSGWYITDSKKAAKTSANGKSNGDSESASKQSDGQESTAKSDTPKTEGGSTPKAEGGSNAKTETTE